MPRLNKAQARELAWHRGLLRFKIREYQEVLYDLVSKDTSSVTVVNCARRFGKSFIMCLKALEKALTCENPYPIIIMASSTGKDIENFIIPSFKIILEDCPEDLWPGWEDGYMRSKKTFVGFPNGAEIRLVGIDRNPDGGRGGYCDLYIIDEAGYVNNLDYLVSSVASPMKRGRKGSKIIMASTPADDLSHPFKDFCERAQKKKNYIELTIEDNKSITEAERKIIFEDECLGKQDVYDREYMCKFVVDEERAITPEFDPKEHVALIEKPDYYDHLQKYVAMDLGVKVDLTAILYAYYDPITKCLVIEDEQDINGPDMTTPLLKNMITQKEDELWGGLPVYRRISDSDNPLLIQDLGHLHQLYFMTTSKDSIHAMVNEVRIMLKEGRLKVNPKCTKLIGCLESGLWDKKRKQFTRSHLYGHYDHMAALIYLIRNLDQFSNPIPDYYNMGDQEKARSFFRNNNKKETKSHKILKNIFKV